MLTRAHHTTANRWARHLAATGARFDVAAKLAGALRFCEEHRTRTFVVPSALVGVKFHAPRVRQVEVLLAATGRPVLLALSVCCIGEHSPAVVVTLPGVGPLGTLRPKHNAWARPLVGRGLACYALRVTGGTDEAPTQGVCVVFTGLDVALGARPRVAPVGRSTNHTARPALRPRRASVAVEPRAHYATA